MMGKVICFLNNKGGVGKTTSAVTVAHFAATDFHKRVLLVDMDPQANTSSYFSEKDYVSILSGILRGAVNSADEMVESLLMNSGADPHDCIARTAYEGLDILPCSQILSEVEERMKADVRTPQQFKLKAQLDKVRGEYDLIVIDCSPSISLLNINVLAAADEVYIPARADGDSLLGIVLTMNLVRTVQAYNPCLRTAGVFFTQHDQRKSVAQVSTELLASALEKADAPLLPFFIRTATVLEQGAYRQEPLGAVDTKRSCHVAEDYLKLTGYILSADKDGYIDGMKKEGVRNADIQ